MTVTDLNERDDDDIQDDFDLKFQAMLNRHLQRLKDLGQRLDTARQIQSREQTRGDNSHPDAPERRIIRPASLSLKGIDHVS